MSDLLTRLVELQNIAITQFQNSSGEKSANRSAMESANLLLIFLNENFPIDDEIEKDFVNIATSVQRYSKSKIKINTLDVSELAKLSNAMVSISVIKFLIADIGLMINQSKLFHETIHEQFKQLYYYELSS